MKLQHIDVDGNVLQISDRGLVTLDTAGGQKIIGQITGDTFFTTRKPEMHFFNKLGALGFNYYLIHKGEFKNIIVQYGKDNLQILREDVIRVGHVKHFKKQGFELQIFVSFDEFNGWIAP